MHEYALWTRRGPQGQGRHPGAVGKRAFWWEWGNLSWESLFREEQGGVRGECVQHPPEKRPWQSLREFQMRDPQQSGSPRTHQSSTMMKAITCIASKTRTRQPSSSSYFLPFYWEGSENYSSWVEGRQRGSGEKGKLRVPPFHAAFQPEVNPNWGGKVSNSEL